MKLKVTSATAGRPPKSFLTARASSTGWVTTSVATLLFQPRGTLIATGGVRIGGDKHLLAVLDLERQVRHTKARVLGVVRGGVAGQVVIGEPVGAADSSISCVLDDVVHGPEGVWVASDLDGLPPQFHQVVLVTGVAESRLGVEFGRKCLLKCSGDLVILQDADDGRPDHAIGGSAGQLEVLR